MKRRAIHTNQQGFTLIELLIATTVFSVILLVAAATLIQIGRMYYKGVITSKTQNVARSVIDDVSRSIQFSSGNLQSAEMEGAENPPIQALCFGNTRYTYVTKAQVGSQTPHALWQDKIGSNEPCSTDLPDLRLDDPYAHADNKEREGRELLDKGMRLQAFSVAHQAASDDTFNACVKVIYGDNDLLNNADTNATCLEDPATCKGTVIGGQWCAVSELSTVVYSRAK